jgi:Na+/H+-dicarboxylate symporter/ABC-type amino acid transport substrate-binding protein
MVLPYLVLTLITGFGQLEVDEAKRLAWRGGLLLLITWGLTFAVVAAMPLTFPSYQSASFFSSALVEPVQPFSIAELYFTENPFHSLSNAVVPAVVLFSSLVGIGLIGLKDREHVLTTLRTLNAAIIRITGFIISLTPIGVFAIGAVAAGTMSPETFERLEVYFITFAAASLLLTFWILPLLVMAVTPFSYREIVIVARDALLTAFVTNNAFIVLPMLVERSKVLLRKHHLLNKETDSAAEVLIPVLFNFPNAGRLLTLLFVPFSAWLAGNTLSTADYSTLLAVGIPSYFAKAQLALPFLMDLFGLPHDLFQLYIPTTIITGKFDSMVTAMNLLAFALIGAGAMGGFLVLKKTRLVRTGLIMFAGIVVTVVVIRLLLAGMINTTYNKDEVLKQMQSPREHVAGIVHRDRALVEQQDTTQAGTRLEDIRQRGTLRVGYDPTNLPFSFFNNDGLLVGFDIDVAVSLARALGLEAEFVPANLQEFPTLLASGIIDVMPSVWYLPYWFDSVRLSKPYMTVTVALAMLDERRHEFTNLATIRASQGLRIGIPIDVTLDNNPRLERYFGNADPEFIKLDDWTPFFEGKHPEIDAFLMMAENASAWTLLHPEYTVVVPQPDPLKRQSAFGLALDADELARVIDQWVVFAMNEGTIQRAYDYWILGQGAEDKRPRWSILRNVLGWQD